MTHSISAYWPPGDREAWETTSQDGENGPSQGLAAAAAFAEANENPWPRTFYHPDGRYVGIVEWNEIGPWSEIVGPVFPRGGPAGLVLQGGRLVAEWGDTRRPDMTFSVAKSYLAILAGLALDDGLIASLDEPVGRTVIGPWFATPHNSAITWRHLLHQSSEWEGALWGKSDQVDHHRQVGLGADNSRKGHKRALRSPGAHYEYNDVRVNLLALALLHRFRKPLPQVLKERIMDPIGASDTWRWHGYSSSWVEIDGQRMQSVSGGAHWGGGMVISARDQARLGLLVARRGLWRGQRLLSAGFIDDMVRPSPTNASYGFLWWLNRGGARHKTVSERSVFALGAGGNIIWVDPDRDLVSVMRWIDNAAVEGFLGRLVSALTPTRITL